MNEVEIRYVVFTAERPRNPAAPGRLEPVVVQKVKLGDLTMSEKVVAKFVSDEEAQNFVHWLAHGGKVMAG